MQTLTVSIVNFNSGNYVLNCLDSLEKLKDEVALEIFIVDNASTDDSFKKIKLKFPNCHFISNSENLGFGKGGGLKGSRWWSMFIVPQSKVIVV